MLSQACQTYYQKRILCRIIIYPTHSTQCSLNLLCRSTLAHLALAPVLIPQTRPKHRSTHTQIFIEYINVYEHKEHRERYKCFFIGPRVVCCGLCRRPHSSFAPKTERETSSRFLPLFFFFQNFFFFRNWNIVR